MIAIGECVGLERGIIDIEFKIKDKQVMLIEINPRLAGPHLGHLVNYYLGACPYEFLIKSHCFEEVSFQREAPKSSSFFTEYLIYPSKAGVIEEIIFPEKGPKIKDYGVVGIFPKEIEEADWMGGCVAFVITEGDSREESMKVAKDFVDNTIQKYQEKL